MKYEKLKNGDCFELNSEGEVFNFACCDCGLVHRIAVALEDNGNIGFCIERDNRKTGQKRRWINNK